MNTIKTILIDLDGTVYDKNNGIWQEMSSRIRLYMREVVGIPAEEIPDLMESYFSIYGSSLHGLKLHHNIDFEDCFAYVHQLDLNEYLSIDKTLRNALISLPQKKFIFTNSDYNHSIKVLRHLGIEDLFEGIIDATVMGYIPKPDPLVYPKALQLAGSPKPEETLFIDDTHRNLREAWKFGIQTCWIGGYQPQPYADFSLASLDELPALIHSQVAVGEIKQNSNLL